MGTKARGYSDLVVGGWGIKLAEDGCRKSRVCTTTEALYSSSEVSLISKGVDGPLLVLRPDGRSGVTGD